jgi:hypothetical protein
MGAAKRAVTLLRTGFSTIPIGEGKRPAMGKWEKYQTQRPTEDELATLFHESKGTLGWAVICGPVSGGLEVLDFDDPDTYEKWHALVTDEKLLPEDLPIIKTPKGWHIYLKRQEPGRNRRLALRPIATGKKVLVETRGDGGYVVTAGSPPFCHPDKKVGWEQVGGTDIEKWGKVKVVDDPTYQALIAYAVGFNEDPGLKIPESKHRSPPRQHGETRPGDEFNQRARWIDILGPHGWVPCKQQGDVQFWTRPGKKKGISASTGFCGNGEKDNLFVFSSSTNLEMGRSIDKFGAHVQLNHGGDFAAAAKELGEQGYGAAKTLDLKATHTDLAATEEMLRANGMTDAADALAKAAGKVKVEADNLPVAADLTEDEKLSELRDRIEMPELKRVIRDRTEDATFYLLDEEGEMIRLGKTRDLTTPRAMNIVYMEWRRRQLPPSAKTKAGWHAICQLILDLAVTQEPDYRLAEVTMEVVTDYAVAKRVFEGEDDEGGWVAGVRGGAPVFHEGRLWVQVKGLRKHQMRIGAESFSELEWQSRLREARFEPKLLQPMREGERVRRRYWGRFLDPEELEQLGLSNGQA